MSESGSFVPTPEQLRGISHPVRVTLLGLLRMDGPQTSAELARATGLNTGATSYHLRQLAQHGFIEDAPGLGSGRERHWRARHRRTDTERPPDRPPGGPEPTTSLDDRSAWRQTLVTWTAGVLQAAQDEWAQLPPAWRQASVLTDYLLRLSPGQAAEAVARLTAVLDDLAASFPIDPGDTPDAELWEFHLVAYPVPGRIPQQDPP